MCTVLLPQGGNPVAVNKIYHHIIISSCHKTQLLHELNTTPLNDPKVKQDGEWIELG
jgi:hypothetical protein